MLICPGPGRFSFHHICVHVLCLICLSLSKPDTSQLLTSSLLQADDLKIPRQSWGGAGDNAGALHPRLPVSRQSPHAALLYPHITPVPHPAATFHGGQHPKPPPRTGTPELTSPPHGFTWGKASEGRFAEKGAGGEERSGSKAPAKSCSLFYRELKCLEHHLCTGERGSPGPWPPAPQLESPLLDKTLFRARGAVKLARPLLRTALLFQCRPLGTPKKTGLATDTPTTPASAEPPAALASSAPRHRHTPEQAVCCLHLFPTKFQKY